MNGQSFPSPQGETPAKDDFMEAAGIEPANHSRRPHRRDRDGGRPHKVLARFFAKVEPTGNRRDHDDLGECWLWRGAVGPRGYGAFYVVGNRIVRAHRFMYEVLVGPIPDGHVIHHLCRNALCVRPTHLRAVTQGENLRYDARARAREGAAG